MRVVGVINLIAVTSDWGGACGLIGGHRDSGRGLGYTMCKRREHHHAR